MSGPETSIVIAAWPHPTGGELQVSLEAYRGAAGVDVRLWRADRSGRMVPAPCGLTLGMHDVPRLVHALAVALAQATAGLGPKEAGRYDGQP